VLPSSLLQHTNSNKTTAVHTADSANTLKNSNSQLESNHTLKAKIMLARWQLTCQSSQQLKRKVDQSQKEKKLMQNTRN
jgi:hypothetical protein